MAGAAGTATIAFGSLPGADRASVAVSDQTGLTTSGRGEAWLMRRTTATHSADEHEMAQHGIQFACEVPSDGTLQISASSTVGLIAGSFSVEWVWFDS